MDLADVERFTHLKSYVSGEAEGCLEGFVTTTNEEKNINEENTTNEEKMI